MKLRITKILLLAAGLAFGLVLVAKVWFERSYNCFLPDKERIYQIILTKSAPGEEMTQGTEVGYEVAPGLKYYSPLVEEAARVYFLDSYFDVEGEDGKTYAFADMYFADSTLFNIMPRPILAGNIKEALSVKRKVAVPNSIAVKFAGNADDAIGRHYIVDDEKYFEIAAVYEDFPLNSEFASSPTFISMQTIDEYLYGNYKGWRGKESFKSYIKIAKGNDIAEVNRALEKACKENIPVKELEERGMRYSFSLVPVTKAHTTFTNAGQVSTIMLILAIILLTSAILNYVLFSLAAMIKRAKTVAVLKCYGADKGDIRKIFLKETLSDIVIALVIAILIVLTGAKTVQYLLGTSLFAMLQNNILIILGGILIALFFVGGYIPATIYGNIPVTAAFKNLKEGARGWKYALLFIQFALAMLFISLFAVVVLQYKKVTDYNVGYNYDNLAYTSLLNTSLSNRVSAVKEVERLPFVEKAVLVSYLPFDTPSTLNVMLPDDSGEKVLFSAGMLSGVGKGYLELLGVKKIAGEGFADGLNSGNIMVSRSFAERLAESAGWRDGAVGKSVVLSYYGMSYGSMKICGVYEDYLVGDLNNLNPIPTFISYYDYDNYREMNSSPFMLLIKLKGDYTDSFKQTDLFLFERFNDESIRLKDYNAEYKSLYREGKRIRDAVMISTAAILIITLIGVAAFSIEEVNRRRKELSIRKINGATVNELVFITLKKLLSLALAAIVCGGVVALYFGGMFVNLFGIKIALSWYLFAGCGLLTLFVIAAISVVTVWRRANANPVENIKAE